MKKAVLITRTLYGLALVVLTLDTFFEFLPQRQISSDGAAFLACLGEAGYLMPLVKGILLLFGACLLAGYFSPLALAMLAPVIVNIVLFHLVLDPGGLKVAGALLVLQGFLMFGYRDYFEELFQAKPQVW